MPMWFASTFWGLRLQRAKKTAAKSWVFILFLCRLTRLTGDYAASYQFSATTVVLSTGAKNE